LRKPVSSMIEVLVIMNNYFHDVATAMLFSTGLLMLVLYKSLRVNLTPERMDFFRQVYAKYTQVARFSLAWILIGGLPRLVYYKRIEWTMALDNRIIPALIIKHVIMFTLVIAGAVLWRKLSLWVKELKYPS